MKAKLATLISFLCLYCAADDTNQLITVSNAMPIGFTLKNFSVFNDTNGDYAVLMISTNNGVTWDKIQVPIQTTNRVVVVTNIPAASFQGVKYLRVKPITSNGDEQMKTRAH